MTKEFESGDAVIYRNGRRETFLSVIGANRSGQIVCEDEGGNIWARDPRELYFPGEALSDYDQGWNDALDMIRGHVDSFGTFDIEDAYKP